MAIPKMKKMKKVTKSQVQVGHWCRIRFDDIGNVDGIIVEVDKAKPIYWIATVFCPATDDTTKVELDQIKAIGPSLEVPVW